MRSNTGNIVPDIIARMRKKLVYFEAAREACEIKGLSVDPGIYPPANAKYFLDYTWGFLESCETEQQSLSIAKQITTDLYFLVIALWENALTVSIDDYSIECENYATIFSMGKGKVVAGGSSRPPSYYKSKIKIDREKIAACVSSRSALHLSLNDEWEFALNELEAIFNSINERLAEMNNHAQSISVQLNALEANSLSKSNLAVATISAILGAIGIIVALAGLEHFFGINLIGSNTAKSENSISHVPSIPIPDIRMEATNSKTN